MAILGPFVLNKMNLKNAVCKAPFVYDVYITRKRHPCVCDVISQFQTRFGAKYHLKLGHDVSNPQVTFHSDANSVKNGAHNKGAANQNTTSYSTSLRYIFSLCTLLWNASQILSIVLIRGHTHGLDVPFPLILSIFLINLIVEGRIGTSQPCKRGAGL